MIKIVVDQDKCQNYGQCVFEAPDIFRLNTDDKLEFSSTAPDEMLPDLEAAVDVCPMQAISVTRV